MSAYLEHFRRCAAYNSAANVILYDACAALGEAERRKQRPAFFNSIHGTLNHLIVGDRIWMGRFEGREMPSTDLDRILYEDFDALRTARQAEDARIAAFCADLSEEFLAGSIRYVNNAGKRYEDPVAVLLPHMFNHQTHHRGQVHDMLSQTEVPPPSLDMHRVLIP